MVAEYINKNYLLDKLNVKVNFIYMSGDDYKSRVPTMVAAGQDMGILAFGGNLPYINNATLGAFAPMDGLLNEYGKGTKELFPDIVWDCMKVGGSIYGVPALKDNCYIMSQHYNVTLAEELGIDMSGITYTKSHSPEMEQLLLDVLQKRNEKHPEWRDHPIFNYTSSAWPWNFAIEVFIGGMLGAVCNIPELMEIKGYDETTVFNLYETPEYYEYAKIAQRYVESGIYPYEYDDSKRAIWNYSGGLFLYISWGNIRPGVNYFFADNFDVRLIPPARTWTETGNYLTAGTSISSQCANKERAMMLINLINTDVFFASTMRFGIEGEHWVINEKGEKTMEGSKRNKGKNIGEWGFRHWYAPTLGNVLIVDAPPSMVGPDNELQRLLKEANDNTHMPSHMGFVMNQEPLMTEIAAVSAVVEEYTKTIQSGQLPNESAVVQTLDEFNAKLYANGLQRIIDGLTEQTAAWRAAR